MGQVTGFTNRAGPNMYWSLRGFLVHYNAVKWVLPFEVLTDNTNHLILRYIAFFGLNITKCPFRQHRRVTGQCADFMDNLVELQALDEVIIQLVFHIAPQVRTKRVIMEPYK
jgi:hypothetical protein